MKFVITLLLIAFVQSRRETPQCSGAFVPTVLKDGGICPEYTNKEVCCTTKSIKQLETYIDNATGVGNCHEFIRQYLCYKTCVKQTQLPICQENCNLLRNECKSYHIFDKIIPLCTATDDCVLIPSQQ